MLRVVPDTLPIRYASLFPLEEQRSEAGVLTGCKREGCTVIGFI
jgi:hypothetical protein